MPRRLSRILLSILFLAVSLAIEARADTTTITGGYITSSNGLSYADNSFSLQGDGLSLFGSTSPTFISSTIMIDTNVTRDLKLLHRIYDSADALSVRNPFTVNGRSGNTTSDFWNNGYNYLSIQFSGTGEFPANPTSSVVTINVPFTMIGHVIVRHRDETSSIWADLTGSGTATAVYSQSQSIPNLWSLIKVTYKFTSTGDNPIDQTDFFIRQHYIDFLERDPDQAGLTGWQNILKNCGTTVAQPCDRIEVSSDFFRSQEFQARGYFVYRFYSTLGQIPHYDQYLRDLRALDYYANLSAQELENNKTAFANQFVTRTDYLNKYGSIADPTTFVNTLLQTTGLPDHPQRSAWINGLANATMSRAAVLRALVESAELYQKYYNEAFVVMQYFGYLRRDPDILYLKWIETMNKTGDYRTMINGFLNSAEYRQRFGS